MAEYLGGEPLAEVVRSGFVEGLHRGSVVVLDGNNNAVAAAGDVTAPIFPRSSNKPLQAIGMLRAGLRLADPAHLALVCGSHSGGPAHIEGVRAMLRCGGLTPEQLACPPDLPIGEEARIAWIRAGHGRERIAMNCSGKHTGMLLTCLAAGWPIDGYPSADHPLQKQLRSTVEELCAEAIGAVGVDGCGAPVLAMSLAALAGAFGTLVSAPPGSAERTVADAMRAYPSMVGGDEPERDDTRLMRGVPGLLAKGGAEGVLVVAIPGVGAVACKIDDGSRRAIGPVIVSALRRLGVAAAVLDELAKYPVLGGGRPVGAVRALW
ncbi:MAG TPA: asparaginase [Micromonosporaceae bacterium]|nr:asparaginase [Micromonosporaceae bacterium]